MEFIQEITVNVSADKAWGVLAHDFGGVYKWATGLYHSTSSGTPEFTGADCHERACDTVLGKTQEIMRSFNEDERQLSYEAVKGFPFFVDSALNRWKVTPLSPGSSRIDMHMTLKTKGLMGKLMRPILKNQMNGLTGQIMKDFKSYVETGKPSTKKAKELAKAARKAA